MLRKIVSSQMIGVDPVHDPSDTSSVHATFSLALHVVGSPVAVVEPSRLGPRHCGQFPSPEVAASPEVPELHANTAIAVTAQDRTVNPNVFVTNALLTRSAVSIGPTGRSRRPDSNNARHHGCVYL